MIASVGQHRKDREPASKSILLGRFGLVSGMLAILASTVGSFLDKLSLGWVSSYCVAALAALATLALTYARTDSERKEKKSSEELLDAYRVRFLTVTNGALQATARRLQDMAINTRSERTKDISGFRQSVVDKACDLVKSEATRSAYFQVVDLTLEKRTMENKGIVSSRNRHDEFTSSFVEGDVNDSNVWKLIDTANTVEVVNDIQAETPLGFNLKANRKYRSYMSAPVRAGHIAFGMLTINSTEPYAFDQLDASSLLVLARMLAAAETLTLAPAMLKKIPQLESRPDAATQGMVQAEEITQ